MKTKTILFIFILLQFSCTLKREEYGKLEEADFFKSDKDLETALGSLYVTMGGPHGGPVNGNVMGAIHFGDLITDIMSHNGAWDFLINHKYDASNCTWDDLGDKFSLVRQLTRCRGYILRAQNSPASESKKNQAIAEAKTIYAFIAQHLYTYIGTVPIVPDEYILNPEIVKYFPRMEKEAFVKLIHNNLIEAIPYLKEPKDQDLDSESGRMNKAIAYMVLIKLYMIEKDWDKVKEYCQEIINMKYYELQPTYKSIFAVANRRNKEVIYGVPRDANVPNSGNTWHALTLPGLYPTPVEMAKWQGYTLRWSFVDTFDPKDKRLDVVVQEFSVDVKENGRVIKKVYNRNNTAPGVFEKGAIPLKYDIDPNQIAQNSNHDIIRFRYADVLLSMAEAENELNGPEKAYAYFNQVRLRTGIGNLTEGLDKNQFRDALLMERAHEFFCEGSRYPDLLRHGKFIEVAKKNPNSSIKDNQLLWPIPQSYIIEYGGLLVNNPGY